MKINRTNNINFQGIFRNNAIVSKKNACENYEKINVAFVELNPHDINDIRVLDKIANSWVYDKFSCNICNDAMDIYQRKFDKSYSPYRNVFYAITAQKDNFDILNYKDILAISDAREITPKFSYILHLQVKPDYIYYNQPEYKGIGTAMLNSFKSIYNKIQLCSLKDKSVRNFYLKNGFTNLEDSLVKFLWKK